MAMQGGTHTEAIRMRRADLEKLCEPVVAEIAGA
jgi:prolyl-tRNA editing enzyme YbaK/EbsC (Cys-tRNA(Pro) deacylase)